MGKRKYLKDRVYQSGQWLELIISIIIVIAICYYAVIFAIELVNVVSGDNPNIEDLSEFLNLGFGLVIGIEFIKMLCKHSPSIIVEVLMFAVARRMIVEHASSMDSLISIICIAILFAVRRFLFLQFDASDRLAFSPKEPVIEVNHLLKVNIPIDNVEDTLYDVFCRYCTAERMSKGVCVYFGGCALRISKMSKGNVAEIEVVQGAETYHMSAK